MDTQLDQGVVYKEVTVEQAEALFDAAIMFQFDPYAENRWQDWCPPGSVGNREDCYSPQEKLRGWPKLRLRVEVE